MLDTHDATRQSLIMTPLDVFRVGIFVTLKKVKITITQRLIGYASVIPDFGCLGKPRLSEFKCHARIRAFVHLKYYALI